jgi:hypothetical protein
MLLDVSSATAFAPPPPAMLFYEPAARRDVGSAPKSRPRGLGHPKPNTSASTTQVEELPLRIVPDMSASVFDRARKVIEISKRLQFLKIQAEIDCVPFSEASLTEFQAFIRETGSRARPSLFLNDNGNLRALWKNDRHEQVGLQFLGESNIQFVIFKQRKGVLGMARVAGIDAMDRIVRHIKAIGAERLLVE